MVGGAGAGFGTTGAVFGGAGAVFVGARAAFGGAGAVFGGAGAVFGGAGAAIGGAGALELGETAVHTSCSAGAVVPSGLPGGVLGFRKPEESLCKLQGVQKTKKCVGKEPDHRPQQR